MGAAVIVVDTINDFVTSVYGGLRADAFFRGYKIVVPRGCVEAVSDLNQEQALTYIREMYGTKITVSSELIKRGFKA